VQAAPAPTAPAPQVIGVDEWAWRRGQRYGTILVNLEDQRVLDLLPERSMESVATWLTQQPTLTVVCRDRSALYADGIRQGAVMRSYFVPVSPLPCFHPYPSQTCLPPTSLCRSP
jgi:Transposase